MRTLLLMRGAMGSGKSTFIQQNHLEPYVIEPDVLRMMVTSPALNQNGSFTISQNKDTEVWDTVMNLLENRMKNGDFTVIDATHMSSYLTKKYIELADRYKYSCFYYQLDTPLYECIERNRQRALINPYKYVPEDAIERAWHMIQKTSLPSRFKRIYDISEIDNYYVKDVSDYHEVKVIGDVHGCYSVLAEALTGTNQITVDDSDYFLNQHIQYVFVGDYLDRGIENKQVLDLLLAICNKKNVVLLEGNHEVHLANYVFNGIDSVLNKGFISDTYPQILGDIKMGSRQEAEFKSQIYKLYKRMVQCFAFSFHGKKFLVTHGGLYAVPKMTLIPTSTMIKGSGKHSHGDIMSDCYAENFNKGLCQDFIQVHGHRKALNNEVSYCLEDSVEFGGNLRVFNVKLDEHRNGNVIYHVDSFKNTVFNSEAATQAENAQFGSSNKPSRTEMLTENDEVNDFIKSNLVKVKKMPLPIQSLEEAASRQQLYQQEQVEQQQQSSSDNITTDLLSLNFSERVFKNKRWNSLTIKARGLFVDAKTGDVKLRSYPKFFNYGELPFTSKKHLQKPDSLTYPVNVWHKYNGFLGIMSVVNNEVLLASKSTIQGQFKDMFQELWDKENVAITNKIKELSLKYNVSFVFEVIHHKDIHIVDFYGDKLVILDAIENKLHHEGNEIAIHSQKILDELFDWIKANGVSAQPVLMERKQLMSVCQSFDEIEEVMKSNDVNSSIEGVVFQDNNGFMFKYKGSFYQEWKSCRGLTQMATQLIHENGNVMAFPYQKCRNQLQIQFVQWLMNKIQSDEEFKHKIRTGNWNIVELRHMYLGVELG